jgi:hypothetical protein
MEPQHTSFFFFVICVRRGIVKGKKMAATYASLVARFAAGTLTDISTLDNLKGIGPVIFAELAARNATTLTDLVAMMSGLSSAEIHAALSYFTRNTRANQCAVTSGPKVNAFIALNHAPPDTRVGYHIQDSNYGGYNALLDVLRYARTQPAGAFGFDYNIGTLPPYQLPRNDESAYCGCQSSRGACAVFAISCEWKTGDVGGGRRGRPVMRGLCVPRSRAIGGFRGRNGFRGQRNEMGKPSGGPLFVAGWRIPGATLDPLAYPLVDRDEEENNVSDNEDEEDEDGGGGRGGGGGGGPGGRNVRVGRAARGGGGGGDGGGVRRGGRNVGSGAVGLRSGRGSASGVRARGDTAVVERHETKRPLKSLLAMETAASTRRVKSTRAETALPTHGYNTRSRVKLTGTFT